ncbi:MAG: isocitrate dehydrogenase [Deltaproteobacteria bacterium SG8_13]|nr:MAG: isocitrate dehydrogenase [Deltaproteobacteria bacterium SG8_13]
MTSNNKIKVKTPIVELDGDEMTRIMWAMTKEVLLLPYLDMELKYYDLHIKNRDDTDDQVTRAAAEAIQKHGVGVKCATITATQDRVREYKLKRESKSPNGIIRAIMDGTVFRSPIMVKNIIAANRNWKRPIHIGRHAYGDVYANQEIRVSGPGRAELTLIPDDGSQPVTKIIHQFDGPGIVQGIHNTDASIRSFAKACFAYGYDQKVDVWFSAKDTISKTYDTNFKNIFDTEFEANWKTKFDAAKLSYFYTLIDDVVARIMKTEGGILWACKNYDGDVMSDMLASAYGSLALMTSVLVSPRGCFMYEAAHGTVQRHYYRHLEGKKTSTNPMAIIFAWTGCLKKRGDLDQTPAVSDFAAKLEEAAIETIENGTMTGDLVKISTQGESAKAVFMEDFFSAVKAGLESKR